MVAADLRTRGRLRDGAPLDDAAAADLDDACRRVADAYGVPLAQVRRAVEIQVDTVVSRGFGVLAVNALAGRLEPSWLVHRNDRLPDPHQPLLRHHARRPGRRSSSPSSSSRARPSRPGPRTPRCSSSGEITGIPPGYDEGSEVRVTFEMGFDGVLHVTAFHVDAGIPLQLTATTGATLSQAEVARERDQLGKTAPP